MCKVKPSSLRNTNTETREFLYEGDYWLLGETRETLLSHWLVYCEVQYFVFVWKLKGLFLVPDWTMQKNLAFSGPVFFLNFSIWCETAKCRSRCVSRSQDVHVLSYFDTFLTSWSCQMPLKCVLMFTFWFGYSLRYTPLECREDLVRLKPDLDVETRGASRLDGDPCGLTRPSSKSCPSVAPSDSHLSHGDDPRNVQTC